MNWLRCGLIRPICHYMTLHYVVYIMKSFNARFKYSALLSRFDSKTKQPNRSSLCRFNECRRRHKFKRIYFSPGAQVSPLLYFTSVCDAAAHLRTTSRGCLRIIICILKYFRLDLAPPKSPSGVYKHIGHHQPKRVYRKYTLSLGRD